MSKARESVRITNQFRRARAIMVYDLSCDDIRLVLEIAAHQTEDDLGAWTVEAHATESPDRPTVSQPGATRSDALQAVARCWADKRGTYGFPTLDWEAVTKALLQVRAI
jgi:hypothetical protein